MTVLAFILVLLGVVAELVAFAVPEKPWAARLIPLGIALVSAGFAAQIILTAVTGIHHS